MLDDAYAYADAALYGVSKDSVDGIGGRSGPAVQAPDFYCVN